jgi:hypothetical protein
MTSVDFQFLFFSFEKRWSCDLYTVLGRLFNDVGRCSATLIFFFDSHALRQIPRARKTGPSSSRQAACVDYYVVLSFKYYSTDGLLVPYQTYQSDS